MDSQVATVIVFAGEYDIASKDRLRRELESLESESSLVIDFSEVTYVDSSCITELLRMNHARRAKGYETAAIVVKRGNAVRRIFEIADLPALFKVVETLDEAVKKNGETATVRYAFPGTYDGELAPTAFDVQQAETAR